MILGHCPSKRQPWNIYTQENGIISCYNLEEYICVMKRVICLIQNLGHFWLNANLIISILILFTSELFVNIWRLCVTHNYALLLFQDLFINTFDSYFNLVAAAAAATKLLQSCPTLCNPTDGSPPGAPVPGILQARKLEWVAIFFYNAWKWKVKGKSLSRVRLLATPWTAAYQAPPSMGFSRQEYWSGVPLPSPNLVEMENLCKETSLWNWIPYC